MDAKTQSKYEARAKIIKAMAHPTRLFIVDELARADERCVCELTEMIGADMSTVSRIWGCSRMLASSRTRNAALQVYYRLRCRCVTDFFECVEFVMKSNAKDQRQWLAS